MRKLFLICISFCLVTTLYAQSSSAILDSMLNKTLDSMQTVVGTKSLSAAIQLSDNSVWAHAKGISSAPPTINVNPSYTYEIGSVTKTLTAACVLQLAEQGFLHLDDSLYQWVDTIAFIDPNITIRQLLRHQSGIYDVLSNPACQPALLAKQDSIWDVQNLIQSFIQAPLFLPGTSWSYSNTNYFLLGMIIEQATGNPYYSEIRNRFLNPLALSSIAIPAFEIPATPVAHVWIDLNGNGVLDDAHNFYSNFISLNATAGAAGGYYARPTDIAKWIRSYMRGDLIDSTFMNQAKVTVFAPGLPATSYGLGLMSRSFLGYQSYGHGGDLSYASSSWYFPSRDISITVHNNDAAHNSWSLLPVVTALLKTYNNWFSTTTGLDESIALESVNAYPNPFNEKIAFRLSLRNSCEKLELQICNSIGQQVAIMNEKSLSAGQHQLNMESLSELSPGYYIANIYLDGKRMKSIKLMK